MVGISAKICGGFGVSFCLSHPAEHLRSHDQQRQLDSLEEEKAAKSILQTQLFSQQGDIIDLIACQGDTRRGDPATG